MFVTRMTQVAEATYWQTAWYFALTIALIVALFFGSLFVVSFGSLIRDAAERKKTRRIALTIAAVLALIGLFVADVGVQVFNGKPTEKSLGQQITSSLAKSGYEPSSSERFVVTYDSDSYLVKNSQTGEKFPCTLYKEVLTPAKFDQPGKVHSTLFCDIPAE